MRYRTFEHPSDIGIEAFGKDIKEVFENAAYGMFGLMFGDTPSGKKENMKFNVEGDDRQSLLVNWLNELLYLYDSRSMIFCEFKITEFNDKMLTAAVSGASFNKNGRTAMTEIKAATYNQIDVSDNKARIVFDV